MLHPASAHFAIVLPAVALVFGLLYLVKPSEMMSKISTRLMVFALIFMGVAWYFGTQDGPDVFTDLSEEGQALLKTHKSYAPYLFFTLLAATAIKFFGCMKQKFAAEAAGVAILLLVVGGTFYQGSLGGKLVYEHSAHVNYEPKCQEMAELGLLE